ncbi:hypothetical protein [uncultured Gammaproteobacteria bacterium]|nr:hypothetical protein [uncultured Gammaproteobacteria bacterium]CAC9965107.1 hypothetical protein [uncultured Gammaproteobacteria bacterium]
MDLCILNLNSKKIIFLMLFFIFKEDKPNSIFLLEDYNGVIIHWLILDL